MSFQFDHWEIEDHCFRTKKAQAMKKKVHYSKICTVVLIPTRQEFHDAGLDLWYNRNDDCSASSEDYFRDSPLPNEEDLAKKLEEEKLNASPTLGTRVN